MKRQRYEAARALQDLSEVKWQHERAQAELASQAAKRAGAILDGARQAVGAHRQGMQDALESAHGIGIATLPLWANELRLATQRCHDAERADRQARDHAQRQRVAVHAAEALHDRVASRCRQALKRCLDQRDADAVAEVTSARVGQA